MPSASHANHPSLPSPFYPSAPSSPRPPYPYPSLPSTPPTFSPCPPPVTHGAITARTEASGDTPEAASHASTSSPSSSAVV
ncbi:unnamed protein product, partial [Closterium sp. NIES-53]